MFPIENLSVPLKLLAWVPVGWARKARIRRDVTTLSEQDQGREVQYTSQKAPPVLEERLALAFILAFSLFSVSFVLHPQNVSASANVSGSCSSSHCYGTNSWSGHMYGATTDEGVRGIGGGNGFTTNSLWVIDTNPGNVEACQAYPGARYGYCWIEAEYKAFGAGQYAGTERWVWADVRPGGVYYEHDLNVLAPNDYGHFAGLYIVQETSPTTTWHIEIIGNSTSYYDEYSTNNRMYPDSIRIGLELSGTGGWSAPVAHFRANGWFDGARNINWQGNAGRKDSQTYPAYGNWASLPAPNGSNNGGDWYTCAQTAGC